jgi:hypothetical protein
MSRFSGNLAKGVTLFDFTRGRIAVLGRGSFDYLGLGRGLCNFDRG